MVTNLLEIDELLFSHATAKGINFTKKPLIARSLLCYSKCMPEGDKLTLDMVYNFRLPTTEVIHMSDIIHKNSYAHIDITNFINSTD